MVRQVSASVAPVGRIGAPRANGSTPAGAFRAVLKEAEQSVAGVRISAHAAARLQQRNIHLSAADMRKVSDAAGKLAAKGGRQSLVVMDNVNLVLDVRNRTVVTAVERWGRQQSIFTNIDSAVFA